MTGDLRVDRETSNEIPNLLPTSAFSSGFVVSVEIHLRTREELQSIDLSRRSTEDLRRRNVFRFHFDRRTDLITRQ